jgi:hypothetical protein
MTLEVMIVLALIPVVIAIFLAVRSYRTAGKSDELSISMNGMRYNFKVSPDTAPEQVADVVEQTIRSSSSAKAARSSARSSHRPKKPPAPAVGS